MARSKEQNKLFYANVEGWLSLCLNLVLFGIKLWAGIVSASVALIADAWHTLSDSVTSIIVLIGSKIAVKPPDKDHPFGHGRTELIASLIIGVLLIIVAASFVQDSIINLKNKESAIFGTVAIVVTAISIVSKELMAQLAIRFGKKVDSQPMIADGWHHRSDALSSVVILIGILFGNKIWWIDSVLGFLVGILIIVTAIEVLRKAIHPLIGETPNDELRQQISDIAKQIHDEELHIHHVHVHKYGNHVELTFHIRLRECMILREAHVITENFVKSIKRELNMVATIYVDSMEKETQNCR